MGTKELQLLEFVEMSVATTVVVVAAARLARMLQVGPRVDYLLAICAIVLGEILVASVACGALDAYRPHFVLLASLVVSGAVWLGTRGYSGTGEGSVQGTVAGSRRSRLFAAVRSQRLVSLLVVLSGLAVAGRALQAVLLPANGFDALAYHLLFVAEWVRTGSLDTTSVLAGSCCEHYPVNGELWAAWLALFTHSDRFVALAQVVMLIVGALGVTSIAQTLGARLTNSIAAGALFITVPVALEQASTAQVDVTMAACVIMVLAFMMRVISDTPTSSHGRSTFVALFALAAALALGVKATAGIYVVLASIAVCIHLVRTRMAAPGRGTRPVIIVALLAVLTLGISSSWYIQSWAETGNPFSPFTLTFAGTTVFEGTVDPHDANEDPPAISTTPRIAKPARSWLHDLDVREQLNPTPTSATARLGGLGLVWLLIGIPCAFATLAFTVRKRHFQFAALSTIVGLALIATPDSWWSRFTIPIVVVGLVGIALALNRAHRQVRSAIMVAALALSALGILETKPLAGLREATQVSGFPIKRASGIQPDFAALSKIKGPDTVALIPSSPLVPYWAIGPGFSRAVTIVSPKQGSAREIARLQAEHGFDWVVTREALPAAPANLSPVAASPRAFVYQRSASYLA